MDAPSCALLGAMVPVLRNLDSVVSSGNCTLSGEEKHELASLVPLVKEVNTSLLGLSEAEDPPLTAKLWMNWVRELSYDMDDFFQQVMHYGAGADAAKAAEAAGKSGLLRISRLQKKKQLIRGRFLLTKIEEFRTRVNEACERHERYDLGSLNLQRRFVGYGPLLPIHDELIDHGPMDVLVKKLATEYSDKQLKVLSIVGPGGVGKTTLAKRLYHKLRAQFECRAFVRVSLYPDMRRLLTSIFIQTQKQQPHEHWDADDLIDNIAKHLRNKRYYIVIDDIWDSSVWDIICPAFPEDCFCSRIITTTQIDDVALASCGYNSDCKFEMRPLNNQSSRDLFFSRVFGSENDCPKEFKETSYGIIRKCGGLPLSTISIASLLACEPVMLADRWKHIERCLPSISLANPSNLPGQQKQFLTDLASEDMKKVLNIVYNNLPPHLKTCLLYLNMYPADYVIRKDDLLKQWVAEGFLSAAEGQDREEVARGYFDELVSRGMIQPVDTNCNDQVLSCTVHHNILDFIAYKSMENSFITIVDYFQTGLGLPDMIRRLSVRFGGAKSANVPASIRMTQVRSLIFFGFFKCVPSIVHCRLLRVLVLHVWSDQHKTTSFDLTKICDLYLLKYLKIACNITVKLPEQVRGLQLLEIMEVDARVDAVPMDIFRLRRLLHLRLPGSIDLPNRIDHMTSLRSLGYFDLSSNSEKNVQKLGQLINLQDLYLTCSSSIPSNRVSSNLECLASILWKTRYLKSLILDSRVSSSEIIFWDGLNNISPHPALLEKLELSPRICKISSLPKWIGQLTKLNILKIALGKLRSDDVDILKQLSALTVLSLYLWAAPAQRIVFNKDEFPVLKYFKFMCSAICVAFMEGALPTVQRLKLGFNANTIEQFSPVDAGFQNLTGLKVVSAKIGGADESRRMEARSKLEDVFSKHPISPTINLQMVDFTFDCDIENDQNIEKTDVIMKGGSDEQYATGEQCSTEDTNKPAGTRMSSGVELEKVDTRSMLPSESTTEYQDPTHLKVTVEDTSKQADASIPEALVPSLSLQYSEPEGEKEGREIQEEQPRSLVIIQKNPEEDKRVQYCDRDFLLEDSPHSSKQGGKTSSPMGGGVHLAEKLRGIKYLFRVKKDVAFIKLAMELMTTIIEENTDGNATGTAREKWVMQLQDLVYDIEDFLDIYNCLRISSLSLAHMILLQQLKVRVKTLQEWPQSSFSRESRGSSAAASGTSAGSAPAYALYGKLYGIDKSKRELLKLIYPDSGYSNQPRVVSIVGCNGVGKSALARAILDHFNNLERNIFHCIAWVESSGCNDAEALLSRFLQAVGRTPMGADRGRSNVDEVQAFLRFTRFLVVIDDLQRPRVWSDAQSAFLMNGSDSSRVIVTTSIDSVASFCSPKAYIYRMQGLGVSESKHLFWEKAGSRASKTPALNNALEETFRKCDGLPVAIISVANYVHEQGQNLMVKMPKLGNYLSVALGASEDMNRAVMNCYDSLPDDRHKICLLYLSIFPSGHQIKRKSLIRRWIAEGLVVGYGALSAEQVGDDCFDNLIDRNIIQPLVIGNNSKVKRVRVHSALLEVIINKSVSRNLMTLISRDHRHPYKKVGHPVRRLSVQGGITTAGYTRVAADIGLDHVRSLTICNGVPFDFHRCKLLRVLDLEGCKGVDEGVLARICTLMFLKYLSLRSSDVRRIPNRIRNLYALEMLDLRETVVKKLPIEVVMLPRLSHLYGQFHFELPLSVAYFGSNKLRKFFSEESRLQTLSGFAMVNNGFDHLVFDMRLLRKVKIWCKDHNINFSNLGNLALSIQKRLTGNNALESLSIDFDHESLDFLNKIQMEDGVLISSIKLRGRLSRLPTFFTSSHSAISELQLCSTRLGIGALSELQKLPCLLYLKLAEDGNDGSWGGGRFVVHSSGFPSLQRLCFEGPELPEVEIEQGGMSSLTSLHLLCPRLFHGRSSAIEGIQYLKYLNEVVLHPSVPDELVGTYGVGTPLQHLK